MSEWLNLIFRWIHVVAGVMWIGHLWFFNFVNAQVAKTYDADSKKKVDARADAARALLVPLGRRLHLDHRHPPARARLLHGQATPWATTR